MDSAHHLQWTQEFGVAKSMAEGGGSGACTMARPPQVVERKLVRPQKDQVTNCPRCQSTNTKFCYYNNYSLTQPRYFCKTCRRYWTEGGTLRNVPVGGGSRKNKKPSSTTSSSCNNNSPSSSSMATMPPQLRIPDLNPPSNISLFSSQNPKIHDHDQGHDLNLGYNQQDYHLHGNNNNNNISQFLDFPKIDSSSSSALNFLRSGINNNGVRGFNSFIPMAPGTLEANSLFASSGFPFQECKQQSSLAFSNLYGNPNNQDQTAQDNINGSLMFTLGSTTIKQHSSSTSTEGDQEKGHDQINNPNGFWNGMLGGGGSW